MVGFVYTTSGASNTYYYDRNIRGDVLGIYDANGTRIVKYSYDAWGNCTIDSSTTNTTLAKTNPIRYRGYYYDEDIKLYYLNSRYYSPLWRRFLSPDSTSYLDPETPNGLNLYAYCNNDPVNHSDPSGHSILVALLITFTAIGAITGGVLSYNHQKETTGEVKFSKMILPIIGGAFLGLAAGGLIASAAGALYGTYKAIVLSKSFMDIIMLGVGVKYWTFGGMAAFDIGASIGGVIFQTEFEMIEYLSPNINPNQPIIENQPQYYK